MKIRAGFVSNSSSSSFCVVGYVIPWDSDIDVEEIEHEVYDNGLELRYGISEDFVIIGKSIEKISDDQTILDYKKEILEKIHKCIGENVNVIDIDIVVDGGYNG